MENEVVVIEEKALKRLCMEMHSLLVFLRR